MTARCQLVNETTGDTVAMACGGDATPLFESYLKDPPDGTFFASLNYPTDCTITFSFQQCNGREEIRRFTPGTAEDTTIPVIVTVPNVKRITAQCSGGTVSTGCQFRWQFQYHYCRCCGG
ncbi:MAG: hypothetical protein ACM3ZQ_01520 [Bacillota bacterium]